MSPAHGITYIKNRFTAVQMADDFTVYGFATAVSSGNLDCRPKMIIVINTNNKLSKTVLSKGDCIMTLQEQLNAIKAKAAALMTPEVLAAIKKGHEELEHAGVLENALKVGDTAPDFRLPNGDGNLIDSEALRQQGPLVILFYRGKW